LVGESVRDKSTRTISQISSALSRLKLVAVQVMSRVSRAAPHLSLEAVEQKLKSTDSYWHRQKWLIVYNGLVDPRPASAIAKQTGVSVATVHKVISQYNQLGVAALETAGKGGRYNSYLTREQEKEFLGKFFEQAAKGQIPTVTQIKIDAS
jgi:transposase